MAESAIHLDGDIESLVAETDVGAQHHFRCHLTGDITVRTVIAYAIPVQVGNLIIAFAVRVRTQSRAMRQIEHAQRLTDHLVYHIVVAAVEARPGQGIDAGDVGRGKVFALVITAQRDEFVLLPG